MRKTTGALGSWRAAWSAPEACIICAGVPWKRSTRCISAAVSPFAPPQAIASAVETLAGEKTRLPGPSLSRRYRSKPKALLLRREALQVASRPGPRSRPDSRRRTLAQRRGARAYATRLVAETHVTRPPSSSTRHTARRRSDRGVRSRSGRAWPTVSYSSGRPASGRSQALGSAEAARIVGAGTGSLLYSGTWRTFVGSARRFSGVRPSRPRRPARTIGPWTAATRLGSSGIGQARRAMGSVTSSRSPSLKTRSRIEIAARRGKGLEGAAVERRPASLRGPRGHAHAQREALRRPRVDDQADRLLLREARLLDDGDTALRPVQGRGHELVHVEARVVLEVDAVRELREGLQARARAAPEGVPRAAEELPVPRGQGHVVDGHAVVGVLGAEDAVPERALVVVGACGVGRPREEVPRELQQVVGAAALLGVAGELGREPTGVGAPAFLVAGSTRAVGAAPCHRLPEVLGDVAVAPLPEELVPTRRADDLRNRGVRVQALQLVASLRQRREDALVVELPGQLVDRTHRPVTAPRS